MKKKKKRENRISLWKTFQFLLSFLWHKDKRIVCNILLLIPLGMLVSFMGIYLPKLVLWEMETGRELSFFAGSVALYTVLFMFFSYRNERRKGYLEYHGGILQMEICLMFVCKLLHTDYENMEKEKFLRLRNRVQQLLFSWSDYFNQRWCMMLYLTLLNGTGAVVYGAIIGSRSMVLLILIAVTASGNVVCAAFPFRYEEKKRSELSEEGKKTGYLTRKTSDFPFGKDVRLYQMQDWLITMYEYYANRWTRIKRKTCMMTAAGECGNCFADMIRNGAAYGYLIFMVVQKEISVSDFVLYFGLSTALSRYMTDLLLWLAGQWGLYKHLMLLADFMQLQQFPNQVWEIDDISKVIKRDKPVEIRLEHVSYRFQGEKENVLHNISLTIKAGEKLALVGANGAGKSTLIKLICGLYQPTEGNIYINGINLKRINQECYFEQLSCVFQDMYLLPLSIGENITLQEEKNWDRNRLDTCTAAAGISEKIESLQEGYHTAIGKNVQESAVDFSGGEKQKLMIARALYKNAPVLILDEPTAALDPLAENDIYLKYASFSQGKTSVFVSHRLSSTRFCDRIILLESGEIREQGTHWELMELGGIYANMFQIQSHYYVNGQ